MTDEYCKCGTFPCSCKPAVAEPAPPTKDDSRCAVCGWPLAESADKGCVRGNCSLRPIPDNWYDEERARREGYITPSMRAKLTAEPAPGSETPCVKSPDGKHCEHWYDDPAATCCFCKERV